tara:strand:+ start:2656 stop:3159 length:504 start_codon:yes stop_codon:yes gene_type:complete
MVIFDVDRTEHGGVTKSVGWEWTPTRQVYTKYEDNRSSYDKTLWLSGQANLTNWRTKAAIVKYRHEIRIDPWLRPKIDWTMPLCYENGAVVGYWETRLMPAETQSIDIGWSVALYDRADFNMDGAVGGDDFASLLAGYGGDYPWLDLNNDGLIDSYDIGLFLTRWTG